MDPVNRVVIKRDLIQGIEDRLVDGWNLDDWLGSIAQIAVNLDSTIKEPKVPRLDKINNGNGAIAYDAPGLGAANDVHFIGSSPYDTLIISDYYTTHDAYEAALDQGTYRVPEDIGPGDIVVECATKGTLTQQSLLTALKQVVKPIKDINSLDMILSDPEINEYFSAKVIVMIEHENDIFTKEMSLKEFEEFVKEQSKTPGKFERVTAELALESMHGTPYYNTGLVDIDFDDAGWETDLVKRTLSFVSTGVPVPDLLDAKCKKRGIDIENLKFGDVKALSTEYMGSVMGHIRQRNDSKGIIGNGEGKAVSD